MDMEQHATIIETTTQTEPIFIQIDKEQHTAVTKVAAQTKNIHFCNLVV